MASWRLWFGHFAALLLILFLISENVLLNRKGIFQSTLFSTRTHTTSGSFAIRLVEGLQLYPRSIATTHGLSKATRTTFFFVLLLPLLRSFSETNTSYSAVILHLNEIKIYIIRRPNIDCRNKKLTIHGNLLLCITAIFEICVQNGARARAKRWGKYNDRKNRVYFS